MPLVLTGATSGSTTLQSTDAVTNTLTLPASTGTLLTTTGDGSGLTGIPAPAALTTASGSAPSYSARAWVNFDGTGTPAERASGNVSSITDHSTGLYSVNFTTAMSDVNYTLVGMCSNTSDAWSTALAGATRGITGVQQTGDTQPTTSACKFDTRHGANATANGAAADLSQVTIAVFR